MMPARRRPGKGLAAALVAVVLAGCANTATATNADEPMVIELSVGGGLAPPAVRVSDSLPRVWVGGDGRYLRQAPDAPATAALPRLEERRISQTALADLLDQARRAGLLADNPDYGSPGIADAMVTRIVIVTGGVRRQVLVSALGYPNTGLDDAALAARARLAEFIEVLQHPERVAGASEPTAYRPAGIAVFVLGAADTSAEKPPATWPFGDLGAAGAPSDWPAGAARCLVVGGDEVTSVANAAAGQDRFTPWRAGDGLWDIGLRPLLPDEHRCADVVS
jgi:hypothetical protein